MIKKIDENRRGFIWRALLCWLLSLIALSNDELTNYDVRFSLRGTQKVDSSIAVILLEERDFNRLFEAKKNFINDIREVNDITDSFYWDLETWTELLKVILQQSPRKVGVSLYFGDNIGTATELPPEKKAYFLDDRVIWSTTTNSLDRLLRPTFTNSKQSNLGLNDVRKDDDGVVRRIYSQGGEVFHLAERLTGKYFPLSQSGLVINFRGESKALTEYSLQEVLSGSLPADTFKDKIVLIGAANAKSTQFQTPVGPLSRVEIMAHMTDNLLNDRWIRRLSFSWYAVFLALLLFFAIWIITKYPQVVALVMYLWMATLIAAISAGIFDAYYLWFPAFSSCVGLGISWIIFVGYHATQIERKNFALEQESRAIRELEQLKNNFVSLISHDFKTPIAKIQSVVTRLQNQNKNSDISTDLDSLQSFSEELNRYIQSILKLLRVESRDFKLNKEVADLNESIEQAIANLRPLAAEKSIWVQTELEPLFSTEFDVTLMKEVLINLIENAIKYTPAGGWIRIRSSEVNEQIICEVEDSGEGLDAEDLKSVWGKFVRGKDQDLKSKGSGLGLYLVKYFIELHGGQVQMTSEKGKGTKVSFTLPVSDDT